MSERNLQQPPDRGGAPSFFRLDDEAASASVPWSLRRPLRSGLLQGVRPRAVLRRTFLPSGFPRSVPVEYLPYQRYHVIQDLATQLRATLATQRVLAGLGVGVAGASALGAVSFFFLAPPPRCS